MMPLGAVGRPMNLIHVATIRHAKATEVPIRTIDLNDLGRKKDRSSEELFHYTVMYYSGCTYGKLLPKLLLRLCNTDR